MFVPQDCLGWGVRGIRPDSLYGFELCLWVPRQLGCPDKHGESSQFRWGAKGGANGVCSNSYPEKILGLQAMADSAAS